MIIAVLLGPGYQLSRFGGPVIKALFNSSVNNCRRAMEIARREFDIPMVLEPEYLASPFLDELSGMTYLSYFMKEHSPGYYATLRWVQNQIPEKDVRNFTVRRRNLFPKPRAS